MAVNVPLIWCTDIDQFCQYTVFPVTSRVRKRASCSYLVLLRLVSKFLHVSRVEISCGLLPTRFPLILLQKCIAVKKVINQVQF